MKSDAVAKVVLTSDESFAPQLKIAIYSLLSENQSFSLYEIYIIDAGLTEKTKHELETLAKPLGGIIKFLLPPKMEVPVELGTHIKLNSFYRLFLAELLPKEDKVLYLDADVLVCSDLYDLWKLDLENVYLAGVRDTLCKSIRMATGLTASDSYINAGVLLCNLRLWRKDSIQEKMLNYLAIHNGNVLFQDQGVINGVCHEKIQLLSPRYNLMPDYLKYTADQIDAMVQPAIESLDAFCWRTQEQPAILHFAGNEYNRPWTKGNTHPFRQKYWRTARACNANLKPKPYKIAYFLRHLADKLPIIIQINLRYLNQKRKMRHFSSECNEAMVEK